MLSFNALLLEETEKLIKFMYNEEFLIIFQNIKMSKNNCKFRVEYTLQFFLHLHSQSHKCFDKSNPTNEIFHKENSDAINSIFVNKHPLFQSGCHKYSGWLHLIKLFIESNNCEISPNFETLCDGVACLIQQLLQPDQYFPIERGKPVPKPKYNPPAQTFLVFNKNL